MLTSVSCTLQFLFSKSYSLTKLESANMARNSDFASYCNNLLDDTSDLMNCDNLSRDSLMEPLIYYNLQPVSETIKE